MNQSLLLHVVERLESLVGKLPGGIQKPILHELTPMKELFLQQRPPRFLFCGSDKTPLLDIMRALFADLVPDESTTLPTVNRWHDWRVLDRGTVATLDGRSAEASAPDELLSELSRQPADVLLFVEESDETKKAHKNAIENLTMCLNANERGNPEAKVIGLVFPGTKREKSGTVAERATELQELVAPHASRLVGTFHLSGDHTTPQARHLMSVIARELPNSARIEMARISKDRVVQADIAQILVKSTTAICTAIGTQPIPLADLPILTTLQLVMVSGIMYISGRERSLRAATEFVGALGANVGAGMLLREGARAVLKFFPGWGNIICGMVAGAGTYAIGRAATVFFLEGVSLKDARRTYLRSRKKSAQPQLTEGTPKAAPRRRRRKAE